MMNEFDLKWLKIMNYFSKYGGCHQIATRSFFIKGYQFPICSRCTGMYLGYIIGAIFIFIPIKFEFYQLILMMMPCFLDGYVQFKTNYISNNKRRFFTGVLFGVGFTIFLALLVYELINILF